MSAFKPIGKAYGHIPHLPTSRMGPADKHCHEGQSRICTEKVRDRHDEIIVLRIRTPDGVEHVIDAKIRKHKSKV